MIWSGTLWESPCKHNSLWDKALLLDLESYFLYSGNSFQYGLLMDKEVLCCVWSHILLCCASALLQIHIHSSCAIYPWRSGFWCWSCNWSWCYNCWSIRSSTFKGVCQINRGWRQDWIRCYIRSSTFKVVSNKMLLHNIFHLFMMHVLYYFFLYFW